MHVLDTKELIIRVYISPKTPQKEAFKMRGFFGLSSFILHCTQKGHKISCVILTLCIYDKIIVSCELSKLE